MLKNLAYHQPVVRHLLSVNSGLYMQLLQAGFLFAKDYELRFYASSLLCLMLFDEVLVVDDNKSEVQLMVPECVLKKLVQVILTKNTPLPGINSKLAEI